MESKAKVMIEAGKKLIDSKTPISFGNPLEGQVDIFEYELSNGKTFLEHFYEGDRYLAFKDLLENGLCYVEYPTRRWDYGKEVISFDKYLATRSERVMKVWLGGTELAPRYTKNLNKMTEEGYLYIVKPRMGNFKDKPNKITVPTKPINLRDEKLRIYPIQLLVYLFNKLKEESEKSILEVTYLKDNHTKRVIYTTRSRCILEEIYSADHVDVMLGGVTNDLTQSTSLERGWIRVAEVGSSKLETGLKAINLARVMSWKEIPIEEMDLSYVDVDLEGIVNKFCNALRDLSKSQFNDLCGVLSDWKYSYKGGYVIHDVETWVFGKEALHTVTFQKDLYDLMISLPDFFKMNEEEENIHIEESNDIQEDLEEEDFSFFDF